MTKIEVATAFYSGIAPTYICSSSAQSNDGVFMTAERVGIKHLIADYYIGTS
jgi:hypothetical protein